ncbi:hypothetical protein N7510_007542 [Penicillium lagena]|uniref:uncharacterized protein n=1 Tax=Penicillium lagena TaxID=94218 RepID=UPI00253FE15A|nr:uncharacterized protein N7510_007542 [Penicillium lagena]KAJ5610823.1 hypothetical protein N7510_007542 [Penicillium lagena]
MTVSKAEEQKAGAMYTSPYMAEFYDVYWKDFFSTTQDCAIYANQLQSVRDQTPSGSPLLVLDVCTGSGRIIEGLISSTQDENDRKIHFIGLDIAEDMINRAVKLRLPASETAVTTSWVVGSALDLRTSLATIAPKQKVDLITIAFGSISHFHEDGQPEQFLREVAQLLRQGTGRAAISFVSTFVSPDVPICLPGETRTPEIPSKQFPGIYYQETALEPSAGNCIYLDRREVTVIKADSEGNRKVLLKQEVNTPFRIFSEEKIHLMMKQAGLRIVEIITIPEEYIWVVQLQ